MAIVDRLGRPLGNLRLSVTDRCNLRCTYCMPEAEYVWLPKADILTFEEIDLLADVCFAEGLTARHVSGQTIRATLQRLGITWKRAKRWITSPDPAYTSKKTS